MTVKVEDRVRVVENMYDGDSVLTVFKGEVGTVTDIAVGDPFVYYIAFDNPKVNEVTDEAPDTTWPFYIGEMELISE